MPVASERAPEVARQRPYIGSLAAFSLEAGTIWIRRLDQRQTIDINHPRLKLELFAVTCDVVGPLTFDLDSGKPRWDLFDGPDESRQDCRDRFRGRSGITRCNHSSLGVVGIPFFAPTNRKVIDFAPVNHEWHRLSGIPQGDRQASGRKRVEGAGMTGLLSCEQALYHRHRVGRCHADRFVEHHPAMDVIFFAPKLLRPAGSAGVVERGGRVGRGRQATDALRSIGIGIIGVLIGYCGIHLCSPESLSRSRLTCGERSNRSIRSASSKRSSMRKRISGANLRLIRWATSPRK